MAAIWTGPKLLCVREIRRRWGSEGNASAHEEPSLSLQTFLPARSVCRRSGASFREFNVSQTRVIASSVKPVLLISRTSRDGQLNRSKITGSMWQLSALSESIKTRSDELVSTLDRRLLRTSGISSFRWPNISDRSSS